jgi:DNA-binding LytR/AlgR family response regulator
MINCIIIEDEIFAQLGLSKLIKENEGLNLLAAFDNIEEFEEFVINKPSSTLDLLFLDIELPKVNGLDYLKKKPSDIPVVITTAYNQYAVEGYELNVLDYLLKPINKERFEKTIQKASDYITYQHLKNKEKENYCYIKTDKVIERVSYSDIVYVEAMRNYVVYYLDNRKIVHYNSLKNVESVLPQAQFVKVQKSFIVNAQRVEKIEKGKVFIKGIEIKLNREHKHEIIQRLTSF